MAYYSVDFSYKIEEWGSIELEADSADQADELGREHVYVTFPEATDITVDAIKEIKTSG